MDNETCFSVARSLAEARGVAHIGKCCRPHCEAPQGHWTVGPAKGDGERILFTILRPIDGKVPKVDLSRLPYGATYEEDDRV